MSVAHLLGSAGDGGAETYFSSLAAALHREGLDQAFVIRRHERREAELRTLDPVTVLPFGGPLDLLTRPLAARALKQAGATATVAWMNRAARHSPRGPWARIGRLGGYYSLKYYRGMDMLVGNTPDICRWMAAEGWPGNKIRYIPNFAAAGPGEPARRSDLRTPEDAPLLLSMGRLHPSKAGSPGPDRWTPSSKAWRGTSMWRNGCAFWDGGPTPPPSTGPRTSAFFPLGSSPSATR
jgi:glycosyltransferase involved in cell wall biosynthesis